MRPLPLGTKIVLSTHACLSNIPPRSADLSVSSEPGPQQQHISHGRKEFLGHFLTRPGVGHVTTSVRRDRLLDSPSMIGLCPMYLRFTRLSSHGSSHVKCEEAGYRGNSFVVHRVVPRLRTLLSPDVLRVMIVAMARSLGSEGIGAVVTAEQAGGMGFGRSTREWQMGDSGSTVSSVSTGSISNSAAVTVLSIAVRRNVLPISPWLFLGGFFILFVELTGGPFGEEEHGRSNSYYPAQSMASVGPDKGRMHTCTQYGGVSFACGTCVCVYLYPYMYVHPVSAEQAPETFLNVGQLQVPRVLVGDMGVAKRYITTYYCSSYPHQKTIQRPK